MPLKTALPAIKQQPGYTNRWGVMTGSSPSLVLSELAKQLQQPLLVICNHSSEIQRLERELPLFLDEQTPLLSFPDWETLPYDYFSPHETIVSERIKCLHRMQTITCGIVIASVNSLMKRLASPSFINGSLIAFKTGQKVDLDHAKTSFEQAGYRRVDKVMEHGEFAVRGSLLDLFPMGSTQPIRVDFFDDEIESLRLFDTDSQLSSDSLEQFELLPAHEFPTGEDAIRDFRQHFRHHFDVDVKRCGIYQDVSNGLLPAGIEYYLPLFSENTASFFDFLPKQCTLVTDAQLNRMLEEHWQDLQRRFDDRRGDLTRPILEPQLIALSPEEFHQHVNRYARVSFNEQQKSAVELPFQSLPDITVQHQAKDPLTKFKKFSHTARKPLVICAESAGRREAIIELFQRHQLSLSSMSFQQVLDVPAEETMICVAPLDASFEHPELIVIAESELFGQHVLQRRRRQSHSFDTAGAIHSLAELQPGDPVVHLDHGVGRYLGLQCIEVNRQPAEYLTLEYKGGDKLYVPVQALQLIHRYSGSGNEHAPWHRLGNEQWVKERKKAAEKAHDVAAELLELYATRSAKAGFKYQTEEVDYNKFAASFPFELTIDQETTLEALIKDLKADRPMDRLVCGDVGFGKTEVAMRAAFFVVQNSRQVAVLVPTTLLAQQHYENFRDRFADWPVRVEVLSRFRSQSETAQVLKDVADGKVDIVIGTHKLIHGDVSFSNLGLVIIDEEHRFGVRQKERLKSLRAEVDVLTLTATPIPRSLNLSLSGLRDLSIIATPPAKRLAIKTFVREYNTPLIREAIQRETMRGGQVYFLHNSVDTIERRAEELRELMPELNIGVAHGQMRERQLEQIMQQFYHHKYHLLLCTTIIETGIDVPNANTIIMERADRLGLAQLHQLRGRVGRSHHQAYAYLLTPNPKSMTKDAVKRLDAISSLEDLGAGFSLATQDMEIRGAGEILGDQQSGQMESVGFSLYLEMLDKAVSALKQGETLDVEQTHPAQTEIELGIPALIPESYIDDVHTRLVIYKQIANAKDADGLREIQVSLIDRFGLIPEHLKSLFSLTELKLRVAPLGIEKISAGDRGISVDFKKDTKIEPANIIKLIQTQPQQYKLEKGTRLRVTRPLESAEEKWLAVDSLIATLLA